MNCVLADRLSYEHRQQNKGKPAPDGGLAMRRAPMPHAGGDVARPAVPRLAGAAIADFTLGWKVLLSSTRRHGPANLPAYASCADPPEPCVTGSRVHAPPSRKYAPRVADPPRRG